MILALLDHARSDLSRGNRVSRDRLLFHVERETPWAMQMPDEHCLARFPSIAIGDWLAERHLQHFISSPKATDDWFVN